jgi:hypothetical protein
MAGQVILNPLSPAPNSYTSSTDPVTLFTKSIKREPKDFPVIKSLNQWDSLKLAVNAMATVQSIAEVLNNFRMNTGYGRYGAAYNMVGFSCLNEELSLLPKNPTEAKLQAMSTRGESTEPT